MIKSKNNNNKALSLKNLTIDSLEEYPFLLDSLNNDRYYSISEASALCNVKNHVLRYWEQEFTQLKPTKRQGNRRCYRKKDIEIIMLIKSLLHQQGYTIQGARAKLSDKDSFLEYSSKITASSDNIHRHDTENKNTDQNSLNGNNSENLMFDYDTAKNNELLKKTKNIINTISKIKMELVEISSLLQS